nr:MAG TPA: hypothetical protein [Caudoviricetes sp.]
MHVCAVTLEIGNLCLGSLVNAGFLQFPFFSKVTNSHF